MSMLPNSRRGRYKANILMCFSYKIVFLLHSLMLSYRSLSRCLQVVDNINTEVGTV